MNTNAAGDTINIKAGTYQEDGDDMDIPFFNELVAIKLYYSEEPGNPMSFPAAPGEEGQVIIGAGVRV